MKKPKTKKIPQGLRAAGFSFDWLSRLEQWHQ
jgi:hypothetical protein